VEGGLRRAVIELIVSAGGDPTKPQEVSRRFGVHRNLAWKLSRMAADADLGGSVRHMPGAAGVAGFIGAMARHGASRDAVEAAEQAFQAFDGLVAAHAGDRHTLDLLIGNFEDSPRSRAHMEEARRLAFRGNSGILGVQARLHLAVCLMAPSAEVSTAIDLVWVGGLVDFRRIRPSAHWVMFRHHMVNDDGSSLGPRVEPVDPEGLQRTGFPLLPEFSSAPWPSLDRSEESGETFFSLPPGPAGNASLLTCIHGMVVRQAGSRHRDEKNDRAEIAANLITPVETFLFDLYIHVDLGPTFKPTLEVCSLADGRRRHHFDSNRRHGRLAIAENFAPIAGRGAGCSTPLMPAYHALVDRLFNRVNWNPQEFAGHRLLLSHPPIPAAAIAVMDLPDR